MFTLSAQDILSRDCADEIVSQIPIALNDNTRFAVRLCLHEALYNAALHGNLEIDDIHHAGLNQQIKERLSDPILEARPVFVTCHPQEGALDIAVKDFGPPAALTIEGEIEGIHGLALIRQLSQKVTFNAEMKELVMHFSWGQAA
jgi:anti-sigma regulatory factor (Ser/Thr protein kinase)